MIPNNPRVWSNHVVTGINTQCEFATGVYSVGYSKGYANLHSHLCRAQQVLLTAYMGNLRHVPLPHLTFGFGLFLNFPVNLQKFAFCELDQPCPAWLIPESLRKLEPEESSLDLDLDVNPWFSWRDAKWETYRCTTKPPRPPRGKLKGRIGRIWRVWSSCGQFSRLQGELNCNWFAFGALFVCGVYWEPKECHHF